MRIPMRMPRLSQAGRKMAVRASLLAAVVAIIGGVSIARLAAPSSAAGESQTVPGERQSDAAAVLAQTPTSAPPAIPVVRPRAQTISDFLEVTGNATAVNQVKLIARVVGFLDKIHFQDGALVTKGDLLFTIQQDQYKAQCSKRRLSCKGSRPRCSMRRPKWFAILRC
jgi:multidrug efflux pump subunit AcrA (membrane-fusion protein)